MDDRRRRICEAVLDLAAAGGNRAVSHGAVDKALGLPKGSTSYYYRSRAELIAGAVGHLTARSREAFDAGVVVDPTDAGEAANAIAGQIEILLTGRLRDALARYALLTDVTVDDDLHLALATCLFSHPLASGLLTALGAADPDHAAADLITLLEGIVFDYLYGVRSLRPDSRSDEVSMLVRTHLAALIAS